MHPGIRIHVPNETKCKQPRGRLLLGLLLLGLLLGGALGAHANVAGVGAGLAKGGVGAELLLLGGDGAGLLGLVGRGESGERAGEVRGEVVASGVAGLGLALDAGEDDKARAVGLEALDVERLALLRLGAAAVVDGNAEAEGLLLADAGELELRDGEATALCASDNVHIPNLGKADSIRQLSILTTDADVVALGLAADGGAQALKGGST